MKKKILVALIIIVALVGCLVACAPKKTNIEIVQEHISTKQTGLHTGASEKFTLNITALTEEEVFVADGVVGKQKSSVVITLKPLESKLLKNEYKYTVVGDKGQLEGAFVKDALGVSFSQTLEGLDTIGKIASVKIVFGETVEEIVLTNALDGNIDCIGALQVAYDTYKDKIDTALTDKSFKREVYMKLVNDKKSGSDEYFWFVSFIAAKDDYWAVMINPTNGDVVSKREYAVSK